jgi:hypothetical protein
MADFETVFPMSDFAKFFEELREKEANLVEVISAAGIANGIDSEGRSPEEFFKHILDIAFTCAINGLRSLGDKSESQELTFIRGITVLNINTLWFGRNQICKLVDDVKGQQHRDALYTEISFLIVSCMGLASMHQLRTIDLLRNRISTKSPTAAKSAQAAADAEKYRPQIEALARQHPVWTAGRIASSILKDVPDSPSKPSQSTMKRYVIRVLGTAESDHSARSGGNK